MLKLHIIKCTGFSTAYDICSILDTHKNIVYSVSTTIVTDKFNTSFVEYEIQYSYDIDGE